ncbi:MAG: methionyl-tRNA formyltransferase [Acidimicrobiia bacterium]
MGAVFLGTPSAAIPSLCALADVADIDLVVTRPERGAGRGGRTNRSPVKDAADQFGFPVAQPETREDLHQLLVEGGFDFGVIVAFGEILTPAMLVSVGAGILNVHFSLLPRWRGAAPVERAIASGDDRTGVTLMKIDTGLDTGPILGEIATPIGPLETGGSLTARLSFLGASLIDATVPEYLNGRRVPVPQITSGATHARPLTKEDSKLDATWPVDRAERTIRAFSPRPGAWIETDDGRIQVHGAIPYGGETSTPGGTIQRGEGVVLAGFADGGLELTFVQPESKGVMTADAWMNGRRGIGTTF